VNDVETIGKVDWATLQIVETHDDEGRIEVMSESRMCEFLGLTEEGTTNESTNVPTQGFGCRMDEQVNDTALGQDIDGAAIPTSDAVPGEMVITYDKKNPSMEVGTMYPTMEEFKLAVWQFAINKEFHLRVEKSTKTVYRAYCNSGDEDRPCIWRINGRKLQGSATTEVYRAYFINSTLPVFNCPDESVLLPCSTIYTYMLACLCMIHLVVLDWPDVCMLLCLIVYFPSCCERALFHVCLYMTEKSLNFFLCYI